MTDICSKIDSHESLQEFLSRNERFPHRAHQLEGVRKLLAHAAFALFDEVGAGKTKQVVDAAQVLYSQDEIDTVLVVAPGSARSTWVDPDPLLGEVAKHAWHAVPNVVQEYHSRTPNIDWGAAGLHWVVTNFEFVRREERLTSLLDQLRGRRTWLVIDESWAIKGNSDQMKACRALRRQRAQRCALLNGTPLADGKPIDLFYQLQVLDPGILPVSSQFWFKARYCVMGGYLNKVVIGYKNLDELNKLVAPRVLSRRTRDCFDLPPMLEPVLVEARLQPETWRVYKQMRDDMVAWLTAADSSRQSSVAAQAIVKAMRLAQITSGYLGGVEPDSGVNPPEVGSHLIQPLEFGPPPEWLGKERRTLREDSTVHQETPAPVGSAEVQGTTNVSGVPSTREIGREKLDAFLEWLESLEPRPTKLLVWCRFRLEGDRCAAALEALYPCVRRLAGGQSAEDRRAAKEALAPGGNPLAACVVGNQKAGGVSCNFSAADTAVYLSNGLSLLERTQSIGRIERPGQQGAMRIVDIIAVGPRGQKTIDHAILTSLRTKNNMAQWTVERWRQILREE